MGGLRGGIVAEEREEGRAAAADHDAERALFEQEIAQNDQQGKLDEQGMFQVVPHELRGGFEVAAAEGVD